MGPNGDPNNRPEKQHQPRRTIVMGAIKDQRSKRRSHHRQGQQNKVHKTREQRNARPDQCDQNNRLCHSKGHPCAAAVPRVRIAGMYDQALLHGGRIYFFIGLCVSLD